MGDIVAYANYNARGVSGVTSHGGKLNTSTTKLQY